MNILYKYLFPASSQGPQGLAVSLGGSDVHRTDVHGWPRRDVLRRQRRDVLGRQRRDVLSGGNDAACMVQRMMWLRRDGMTITNIYIEVTQLSSIQCFNVCLLLVRRRTYQQWLDTKFPSSIKPLVYVLPCRCYRPNNTA